MSTEESEAQKKGGYLSGRHIDWLIQENFRICGEKVKPYCAWGDLLEFELKNDNVQVFDTKWDEVLSSIDVEPANAMLEKRCTACSLGSLAG